VHTARTAAAAAAASSGVEIVSADSLELQQRVLEVVDRIWRPPPGEPVITLGVLRAMVHAGNYCAAAVLDGRLVGVCLGFLGDHPPRSLHSHIAGVTRAGEGRHIGYALKLHQRAWALDRGLDTVTWTFDPLVRRNAYFNTIKLAARPIEYLVDFYGEMTDEINAGQGSDRLLVQWSLLAPGVIGAAAGDFAESSLDALQTEAVAVLEDGGADGPIALSAPATGGPVLVRVPPDIEQLRLHAPELGKRWRTALREAMVDRLGSGWTVRGCTRNGWYVLEPPGHRLGGEGGGDGQPQS
jgi:predicted GNAT superfamily acetyltransferase